MAFCGIAWRSFIFSLTPGVSIVRRFTFHPFGLSLGMNGSYSVSLYVLAIPNFLFYERRPNRIINAIPSL